jgi:hypothetical protein
VGKIIRSGPPRSKRNTKNAPPGDRKAVLAETSAKVAGIDLELSAQAGATPEQKRLAEVEQMIASDVALVARPQVRAFVRQMMTETMVNFDGSPMLSGEDGASLHITWWQALFRTGMSKCLEGDVEWAKLIWNTLFGKPREDMQVSGMGGGPIQTVSRHEGMSAQQMAETYLAAQQVVDEMRRKCLSTEVEAIEVSTDRQETGLSTEPVAIPVTTPIHVATRTQATAEPPQQQKPTGPATGIIPRR